MRYFLDIHNYNPRRDVFEYVEVTKQQFIEVRKKRRFNGLDEVYRFIGLPTIPSRGWGDLPICCTRMDHKLTEDKEECVILRFDDVAFMRKIYRSIPGEES